MTTDTLAKLAAELAQLASEGPALIHQSGAYICRKLGDLPALRKLRLRKVRRCGKDQAEGWALYCVGCLEKQGFSLKPCPVTTRLIDGADLTGPNDTAAQLLPEVAVLRAPSEPFSYFKAEPFGWTDCAGQRWRGCAV